MIQSRLAHSMVWRWEFLTYHRCPLCSHASLIESVADVWVCMDCTSEHSPAAIPGRPYIIEFDSRSEMIILQSYELSVRFPWNTRRSREASKAASGSTGDGLFQDLSERFMVLDYVKSHIIRGMIPFDFMEDQERRCFYREMRSSMKMGQLGSKRVSSSVIHQMTGVQGRCSC